MSADPVKPDPAPETDAPAAPAATESVTAPPAEPAAEEASAEETPAAKRTKTTRERAEERRQEKLDYVREQVDSGSLVIRRMTDDELKDNQPRPVTPKPPGRRGR